MLSFKTDNKTVTVEIKAEIKSKKQAMLFRELVKRDPAEAIEYLKSFNERNIGRIYGIRTIRQNLNDQGIDKLEGKEAGYYLKQYNSMFDCETNHKPNNSDKGEWIGVEIECTVPYDSVNVSYDSCGWFCDEHEITCCSECGHECDGSGSEDKAHEKLADYLTKRKIKRCSVKHDGSIDAPSGHFAAEVTILIKKNDREPLLALCKALNDLDAEVNKSCGMHVHLDQRDLITSDNRVLTSKIKRRAQSLGNCLDLFSQIVPKSRLDNHYCKMEVSGFKGGRYYAVNVTAFSKYKTIEIRLHSATTDFNKINNWIDLLLLVQSSNVESKVKTLDDFCMSVDVPERLIEYVEKRIAKFKAETDVQEEQTSSQMPLVDAVA